jgi:hypothetical protein
MDNDELDGTAELNTAAVLRMIQEDLAATGVRKALEESAQARGHETAEAVYRTVATLRDSLRPQEQEGLAVCFEWARAGIVGQASGELPAELKALHAAYGYARDVMLETAQRGVTGTR